MQSQVVIVARVLLVLALAGLGACDRNRQDALAQEQPTPPGTLKFAGTPPVHPFHSEGGNYYSRTIFETDGPKYSHIEVRDILVPPRTKSQLAPLPGPAIIELRTGNLTLATGTSPEALVAGTIYQLAAGQPIKLENPDAIPAIVRLYLIQAR
jgi:hypothetical protein